jgi:hypothetical protein
MDVEGPTATGAAHNAPSTAHDATSPLGQLLQQTVKNERQGKFIFNKTEMISERANKQALQLLPHL